MSLIHHYAVMGNPITHSKSPLIHHTFAQQIGTVLKYHIDYSTILVGTQTGDFEKAVQIFLENGGSRNTRLNGEASPAKNLNTSV